MPDNRWGYVRDRLEPVLREAGAIALAHSKKKIRQWIKAGNSPVSEADIAVNDFLTTRLPPIAPDAGWLSEETEDNSARLDATTVWIVDPIDGTRSFLDGLPDWCIAVALVDDGRPAVAAVYAPVSDEMFLAARDQGVTVNGHGIHATAGGTLAAARVAGPKSHLRRIAEMQNIAPQPKVYSLALRLAKVAQGQFDAAFASSRAHDWDLAAADLLVHEAGGALTDFEGQTVQYNRATTTHGALLAAGRERHRALIELVRDHRSEFA